MLGEARFRFEAEDPVAFCLVGLGVLGGVSGSSFLTDDVVVVEDRAERRGVDAETMFARDTLRRVAKERLSAKMAVI